MFWREIYHSTKRFEKKRKDRNKVMRAPPSFFFFFFFDSLSLISIRFKIGKKIKRYIKENIIIPLVFVILLHLFSNYKTITRNIKYPFPFQSLIFLPFKIFFFFVFNRFILLTAVITFQLSWRLFFF